MPTVALVSARQHSHILTTVREASFHAFHRELPASACPLAPSQPSKFFECCSRYRQGSLARNSAKSRQFHSVSSRILPMRCVVHLLRMSLSSHSALVVLFLLGLPALSQLSFIDDANSTIIYTGPAGSWGHASGKFSIPAIFPNGTTGSVTDTFCFNNTL
jgi:hypothetical protein